LRWWGWIEPLHLPRIEEQLLLAWLLDSPEVSAPARVWAAQLGRHSDRLVPVGDAPSWTARAEGLKRWMGGRPVNADPWRLFPANGGLGTVSTAQILREPLEGRRQILVLDVPERSAGVVLAQHPDRRQKLTDPHLGAEPPDFI
jgi:hypothetical protein